MFIGHVVLSFAAKPAAPRAGLAALFAGGPPPSVTALLVTAFAGTVLLLAWARWVDRHRDAYSHRAI